MHYIVRDEFVARHKARKHRWNPYTSEVQRFSVYPRIQVPSEEGIRVGDEFIVSINNVDEKGRGIASYRGKRVIVYNASLGSKVRVKAVKIAGDTVYAQIVKTLSEADTEY
jgi:predicted RNA-binding protein with TRAM domain